MNKLSNNMSNYTYFMYAIYLHIFKLIYEKILTEGYHYEK